MSESINKEKGHFRRNWLLYTVIIVSLLCSGYLWISKSQAIKRQAKEFETEKTMLIQQAQETFQINSAKHLELMMKTFVWAVRGEMIRGNQEQADQYFKQLVKADKIDEVTLVNSNGEILITTNKKNEGSKLTTDYAEDVMKIEEMTIFNRGNKQIVASPLMALDSRMGTLLVIYNTDIFQLAPK